MLRKRLLVLLSSIAIFAMAAAPIGSVLAAVSTVDNSPGCNDVTGSPSYCTIGAAVAASSPGDTINVAAGTYPESVTIPWALTLNGPNAGVSALGARGPEATVTSAATTFNLLSTNVTIDGFTISGLFGVYANSPSSGVRILNNIVSGGSRALSFDAPGTGIDVVGNDVSSPLRQLHISGPPLSPGFVDVAVNENRFSGTGTIFYHGNTSIAGYEFKSNEVLNDNSNMAARISGGDVSDNSFAPATVGGLLLQINLHQSTVTDNSFDGDDSTRCLQLFGVQFGLDPSKDVLVSDNTFTDCSTWALQFSEGIDGIDVLNNDFVSTTGDAINTRLTGWTLNADIHVNYNNITGSTVFGVNNTVSGTLDAECNWWGAVSGPGPVGPGTGDRVSTGVDYTPWLTAPAPSGACNGPLPPVPTNKDQCKNNGWMAFARANGSRFKNQGDCVQYVNTGK